MCPHRNPQAGRWAGGLCWLVHTLFLSLIGETNGGATCLCKASWGCLGGATQYCYTWALRQVTSRSRYGRYMAWRQDKPLSWAVSLAADVVHVPTLDLATVSIPTYPKGDDPFCSTYLDLLLTRLTTLPTRPEPHHHTAAQLSLFPRGILFVLSSYPNLPYLPTSKAPPPTPTEYRRIHPHPPHPPAPMSGRFVRASKYRECLTERPPPSTPFVVLPAHPWSRAHASKGGGQAPSTRVAPPAPAPLVPCGWVLW